ncbi:hypothetical protein Dimus_024322 [Dionaea muscipula]
MDAFWDTLPKVDNPLGPTTTVLPPEVQQKEAVQEKEGVKDQSAKTSSILPTTVTENTSELIHRTTTIEDKVKNSVEADPTCPSVVQYQWPNNQKLLIHARS